MHNNNKKVLIVGIKGVAMSHIAVILKKMGYMVEGADVNEHFITDDMLAQHGITVHTHFDIEVMPDDVSHVIYSAAHGGTQNQMVKNAVKNGVQIMHQSEFLGNLLKEFKTTIAVCGTHGKTTTTSLLAHALINLGVLPSYFIGAPSFGQNPGSAYNDKNYFVIEADEYGLNPPIDVTPKFLFLHPHYVICTNIDFDHPDVYKNLNDVKKAFSTFLQSKNVVACFDDEPLMDVLKLSKHASYITYGFNTGADAQIVNYASAHNGNTFTIRYGTSEIKSVHTGLSGRKNALNAAAVVIQLLQLGFDADSIVTCMAGFNGAKRRMELLYSKNGYTIIDDYAHHPQEISATINAVREQYPESMLRVVFQPHTFSRTESLLPEFCEALGKADATYIAPIFASAREDASQSKITTQSLASGAAAIGYIHVAAFEDIKSLIEQLATDIVPGEVLLIMGAGDIYKIAPEVLSALKIV